MSDGKKDNSLIATLILTIIVLTAVLIAPTIIKAVKLYIVKQRIHALDPKADTSKCGKTIDGFTYVCTVDTYSYKIRAELVDFTKKNKEKGITRHQTRSTAVYYQGNNTPYEPGDKYQPSSSLYQTPDSESKSREIEVIK